MKTLMMLSCCILMKLKLNKLLFFQSKESSSHNSLPPKKRAHEDSGKQKEHKPLKRPHISSVVETHSDNSREASASRDASSSRDRSVTLFPFGQKLSQEICTELLIYQCTQLTNACHSIFQSNACHSSFCYTL